MKKVLIAEDHESANISVQKTLEEEGISDPEYVYYCDDALVRVRKAKEGGQPYDLLITDLYFDVDHRDQIIKDGVGLIRATRAVQSDLSILVFSAEGRQAVIESLYGLDQIDGYVRKGRHDAKELKNAIEQISRGERYFSRQWVAATRQGAGHDFKPVDIAIIALMAQGVRQRDIPGHLERDRVQPSSLSSVEKRLNLIRAELNFSSNEQLVAYCKDMGII